MPQDKMNQLFLRALALEKEGKLDEAIEIYQLIKRENSPKFFAQAQYNLALIWRKKGEQEKEIAVYKAIQREDNPKAFAKAQFNLGIIWKEKGEQEKAIAIYETIQREDDKETFAKAQVNLALIWEKKDEQEKAIAVYETIQREDNPEAFARAQLGLAEIWADKGEQEKAIAIYETIQREDDKETFAKAQVNLALTWADNGKWKKSANILLNIKRSDSQHVYSKTTEILLNGFIPELIKEGHRAGKLINRIFERVKFDYRHDILKFIFKSKNVFLLNILDCATEILNELKIKNLESEDFEKNIAHYTRPLIGFSLLNPTEEKSSSKFRLSTIKGVNDPTEGAILKDFLNYGKKTEDDLITFISCFTFNHDSLNQFRLYGKEKGQEASGISLVFERDKFFNQEVSAFNTLSHQNVSFKDEAFLDNKKLMESRKRVISLTRSWFLHFPFTVAFI
ncbi:tetratricopeptide repeat protein [uncultured Aggregatibacter sp.]|nr:tetratricopeptide repeat protein [uncultured Aggregatibacter sp.]